MSEIMQLADEVFKQLPRPLDEDVIDRVFCAIEQDAGWLLTYSVWHNQHRCGPQMVGRRVSRLLDRPPHLGRAKAQSKLIETYTKLDLRSLK